MSKDFLAAIKERRSIYAISKESPISDERILKIVEETVTHVPSSFNSQSTRIVVLFGEQHNKLWDLTTDVLKAIVPEDQFESTQQRMDGFRNGYGTILFFEDQQVVIGMQEAYATYQDRFPVWAQHTNAMHQFVIWTALELEGLGANLQHYNPLIDEKVKADWNLPESWQLVAQMPFGKPTAPAGEKQFKPMEDRLLVFK
ncbi:nitroreductase family protein [Paenibacillus agricola]|uniref:Nitroreductase family protein n=1 Tax=Paenibacillus agricola TaxID=2716264 RepID=A0ABX0JC83_9BACL|nr:nitroreductase family protein [Paenibacillus agricola]NHN31824.1 nitroreductase family protein [Paenibacillus agricola]